jgi:ABC-2 type transport system ATP-binding protein
MAVQVRGLKKSFSHKVSGSGLKGFFSPEMRKVEAVKGIDLEIEDGELLAFIGPNGAGKSTTIKLITGILYPDEGEISVLGLDPHKKRRELAYSIGSVFGQKSQLWYHLPPIDSLRLLASIYGLANRAAADRIDYLAEVLEIGEYLNQPVRKLSLGQRIRCEIAGSLIHSPRIIFLDEPTIGLDLVAKQKLRNLIRQVNRDEDVTVFLTSHDVGDIENICRRVVIINEGSTVWDGRTTDLKYRLLDKRVLSLKLEHSVDIDLPGVQIIKRKEGALKLEVAITETPVQTVLQYIMERTEVHDIGVSSVPMEEVIARIYQGELCET